MSTPRTGRPTVVLARRLPGPVEELLRRELAVHLSVDDHPFGATERSDSLRTGGCSRSVTDRVTAHGLGVELHTFKAFFAGAPPRHRVA